MPPAALTQLLVSQPSILAYDLARLEALSAYLAELGVGGERLGAVLVGRPSLLGLTVDRNLRLMVDYLRSVGTDEETLLKYITESL